MKLPSPITHLAICGITACLVSCGAVTKVKDGTMAGISKVGDGFGAVGDLATSPFRPGIPVVEPRKSDLEEFTTGEQLAQAHQREQQRKRGWWIFAGSVDFEEPELSDTPDAVLDNGLLPPIQ